MPALNRAPAPRELKRLIQLFLRAETDVINEIARLRSRGLADYHAEAALERVQTILLRLSNECWSYVPKMIERQFYFKRPEDRKPLPVPETAEKHGLGYANAAALTSTQTDIVQRLVMNLMGEIEASAAMAAATLQSALLGRVEPDVFRRVGLEQAAAMQAQGAGAYKALPRFVEALRQEGVTAFIDKAGRRWSLHAYGAMVLRTTSRQAEVLAVLTADEGQDLYKISAHGTTCKLCAPLEGRVYSRSGTDPDFPPLAAAFGKVDPSGPDTLANSWLNIHPNCLHVLLPWTPAGLSPEELRKIKEFSSFRTNPPTRDPRSQQQIDAYRKKEQARAKWLSDYRQYERYRLTIPDRVPKSFQTFQKHKRADDEKYRGWLSDYREAKRLEKYSRVRYHEDGTVVVTDDWRKRDRPKLNRQYRPNAVIDTMSQGGKQHDRTIYDASGVMRTQIHGGDHGHPKQHPFGRHGEHVHDYTWPEYGRPDRPAREATKDERIQHRDILGGDENDS